MKNSLYETNFENLNLISRGKVRDIYEINNQLLIVASDRLSAYDVILPDPIPEKGKILNQISLYWFDIMKDLVPNHIITADVNEYPDACEPYLEMLDKRSMLVKKAEPLPVECIVRGYISGSGWSAYEKSGEICGIKLPDGLQESDILDKAIFTPSTKAEIGEHDENIAFDAAVELLGEEMANKVKDLSLAIYKKGADLANEKGIIIADTKFEFGTIDGEIILIDEVLTPDSSRFWPKDSYNPGSAQKSFDKQYTRDYLTSIGWDKKPPAPVLPEEIIIKTREKYLEALTSLAGKEYAI